MPATVLTWLAGLPSRLNPSAVRAGLLVAGTCLLLVLAGDGWQHYQRHRHVQAIERPAAAHAQRQATRPAARHDFDSVFFTLAGRAAEAHARAATSQHLYDSTRRLLPAALPQLPARPPRYQPAH